jgi:hypothetical protein
MASGLFTGLGSAKGLFLFFGQGDAVATDPFCLYLVEGETRTLLYEGTDSTFLYDDPSPGVAKVFELIICGECPSDPDEVSVPAYSEPVIPPLAWERNCAPARVDWGRGCAPARSVWDKDSIPTPRTWTKR